MTVIVEAKRTQKLENGFKIGKKQVGMTDELIPNDRSHFANTDVFETRDSLFQQMRLHLSITSPRVSSLKRPR